MPGSDELPGELDLELTAVVCDLQLDLELDHSLTAEFERAPKVKVAEQPAERAAKHAARRRG
jgi:hypothetical protein